MLQVILPTLLFLNSIFLILLVLIQRGRGGGLAGAFGGLGGQSAFGTKAGDLFTRITVVTAAVWIFLCAASVNILNTSGTDLISSDLGSQGTSAAPSEPVAAPKGDAPASASEKSAPADSAPAESAPAKASDTGEGESASAPPSASPAPTSAPPSEGTPAEPPEKKE